MTPRPWPVITSLRFWFRHTHSQDIRVVIGLLEAHYGQRKIMFATLLRSISWVEPSFIFRIIVR